MMQINDIRMPVLYRRMRMRMFMWFQPLPSFVVVVVMFVMKVSMIVTRRFVHVVQLEWVIGWP